MWLQARLKIWPLCLFPATIFLMLGWGTAGAAFLNVAGSYNGGGRAAAMAMILEQDQDQIYGRIVDGRNNVFQISGRVNGKAVQGTLYNQSIAANFQIELRASGLKFVIIPLVDGRPDLAAMRQIAFERGRVTHPALVDYRVPPPRRGETIDLLGFLGNYRNWSKDEVAAGFRGLADADRAELRTYDHLQADLMNRLCRAHADAADLAAISQGEGLDCARLIAVFDEANERGLLAAFYEVVELQRAAIYAKVTCRRNAQAAGRCKDPAEEAPPWRRAERILVELDAARAGSSASMEPTPQPPRLSLARVRPPEAPVARKLPLPKASARAPANQAGAPESPGGPGFVAFFQSAPKRAAPSAPGADGIPEVEEGDLLAGLDMTLKPSTARLDAASAEIQAVSEEFLDRVRKKMRRRPDVDKSAHSAANATGAISKGQDASRARVPSPRPRPRKKG